MVLVSNIYTKNYSSIANIQNRETVYYNLTETTPKGKAITYYGIEVIQQSEQGPKEGTRLENISEIKGPVLDLIKFLYENSIKPDSAPAIVSDLISAQEHC